MKTFIRLGAGLSSTFFFISGAVILAQTRFDNNQHVFPLALGLFLLGIGCFTGPFFWLLAEKWFPKTDGR